MASSETLYDLIIGDVKIIHPNRTEPATLKELHQTLEDRVRILEMKVDQLLQPKTRRTAKKRKLDK